MEPRHRVYLLTLAASIAAAPADGRVLRTQEEGLKLAFPSGTAVERRSAYLTEDEALQARALARAPVDSRVWTYYIGRAGGNVRGYAYFETHTVRTLTETLMAALDSEGRVRFVELLAFHEPEDYLPGSRWLGQFEGKSAEDPPWLRRGIRNMAGASLTSQAVTDAVRRILAVHAVIHRGRAAPGGQGRPGPSAAATPGSARPPAERPGR